MLKFITYRNQIKLDMVSLSRDASTREASARGSPNISQNKVHNETLCRKK